MEAANDRWWGVGTRILVTANVNVVLKCALPGPDSRNV